MGVGFKEFYCCGKLKSVLVALTDNNKQQCTKEGCCKTKYQFLKLNDNHLASTDIYLPAKYFTALHLYIPDYNVITFAQQTVRNNRSHAPPLYDDGLPLYLSNCVFRI
jgi:hypothetical protein